MDYQSHDAVLAVMLQLDADALQDTTPVMLVLTGRQAVMSECVASISHGQLPSCRLWAVNCTQAAAMHSKSKMRLNAVSIGARISAPEPESQ